MRRIAANRHGRTRLVPGLLLAILAAAAPTALAQPAGRAGSCTVAVAFEHLAVRAAVGISNYYHAVVVIGGPRGAAFEANPSGGFPAWGTLVTRRRNLASRPLKEGHIYTEAGLLPERCDRLAERAQAVATEVTAAHLPYNPSPELAWKSVNSNSFAHYLFRRLGVTPPPSPFPPSSGWVPGYHAAISD